MGVDVNTADSNGNTALIIAVTKGDADIARKLLDAGANWDPGIVDVAPSDEICDLFMQDVRHLAGLHGMHRRTW